MDELVDAADPKARRNSQGAGNSPERCPAQFVRATANKARLDTDVVGTINNTGGIAPNVEAHVEAEPPVVTERGFLLRGGVVRVFTDDEISQTHATKANDKCCKCEPIIPSQHAEVDPNIDGECRGQVDDVGQGIDEIHDGPTFAIEHGAPGKEARVVLGRI